MEEGEGRGVEEDGCARTRNRLSLRNETTTTDAMTTPWPHDSTVTKEEAPPATQLPKDMHFNEAHVVSIATYSVLLVVSAIGNICVLCTLLGRKRGHRSRINTMLLHLAIADLLVTFLMMPLEIAWAATVTWRAGDAACRVMAFFRVFGLFLSGFVLACVSIDRYYAVLKPLKLNDVDRRGKVMLSVAWGASVACSLPQVVVFHVERHPEVKWFKQCVTFNSFPSHTYELTYSIFGMVMMYVVPLAVITFSYASILAEIFRRSRDSGIEADSIRRSSLGYLGKAKIRTLKMTITIVLVFFVCWTPYNVMSLWYWLDKESAELVDQRAQKALFLFACTNSCANPLVYGLFNIRRGRGKLRQRPRGARPSRGVTVLGAQRFDRSMSAGREGVDGVFLVSRRMTQTPHRQSAPSVVSGTARHQRQPHPESATVETNVLSGSV